MRVRSRSALGACLAGALVSAASGQVQQAKLLEPDAIGSANFGFACDIDALTAVIGASGDTENGFDAGAAYVHERDQGGANAWGQTKKLTPLTPAPSARFGQAVAIDADSIAVGAPFESSAMGAAYVFGRDAGGPGSWGEVRRITAPDGAANDLFGVSIDLDGDLLVVGAQGNASNGAAYVFGRNVGGTDNWGLVKKLTASDGTSLDFFGHDTAIDGDTVVVGAYNDAGAFAGTGSVYVFERNFGGSDNWGQVRKLTPSDPNTNEKFGWAVDIDGDDLIAGSRDDADNGSASGSAFVFGRDAGGADNWGEVMKLLPLDGASNAQFGHDVSISDGLAAVGAPFASDSGRAYLFARDQGGPDRWEQSAQLRALDADASDQFGVSVARSVDTLIVGASADDESALDAGAAYVFGGVLATALAGDCDDNGQSDLLDIASGLSADCNNNLIPDACDIASGFSLDADGDGIPDECFAEPCVPADLDGDGDVDVFDFGLFAPAFGTQCEK